MKIFYISRFQYSWSTETYVAHAFKQNGVEVFKRIYTSTGCANTYISQIQKQKPDVVLFGKVSHRCFKDVIKWCKSNNILTACWIWDLYWGYRPQRPAQFLCDLLFTTDGGHVKEWKDYGCNHITIRQGVHEPEHILYPLDIKNKLTFVGSVDTYKQRQSLTTWLRHTYRDKIVWCSNVRNLALNQVLSRVKIVVGDSYPSPHYWSNRVYEILGRGGFLLFPETPGLDKEFTDGIHYVSYPRDNFKKLYETIEYWLAHDKEREKIRVAGFEECKKYTYTTRVKELLGHIEQAMAGKAAIQATPTEAPSERLAGV